MDSSQVGLERIERDGEMKRRKKMERVQERKETDTERKKNLTNVRRGERCRKNEESEGKTKKWRSKSWKIEGTPE
jgi:hypothetical protein